MDIYLKLESRISEIRDGSSRGVDELNVLSTEIAKKLGMKISAVMCDDSILHDKFSFTFLLEPLPEEKHGANIPEKPPIKSNHPKIDDLLIADIRSRSEMGKKKYGTMLQPFNGRDPLWDAYQESIDLTKYLCQAIYERDHAQKVAD